MRRPERILVLDNSQEGAMPGVIACTDLDTGESAVLRYWPTHKGADGEYDNPANKMEPGRCYKVGLRFSSRVGHPDEWMVRDCEEIAPESPPRVPTKDDFILWQSCLKEAGESMRNDQTINGGAYDPKAQVEAAESLFRGTMRFLAAYCGEKEK